MAKKVKNNKVEVFGKVNNYMLLLSNTLIGLFLCLGSTLGYDVIIGTFPKETFDDAYLTLIHQSVIAFIVLFIVASIIYTINRRLTDKESKGTYVIFGILLVSSIIALILDLCLVLE